MFISVIASTSMVRAQGYIVHDLTTGIVNGTTTPIAYGSPDDTWKVSPPGSHRFYQAAFVCSNLSGAWGVNNCGRWITPNLNGIEPSVTASTGVYQYETTFSLPYVCAPWAKVNFSYIGGDNNIVAFYLNGHSYPLSPSTANDFNPLTQNLSINLNVSDLLTGINSIIVQVSNTETYTGFYACGKVSFGFCSLLRPSGNGATENIKSESAESFRIFPNPGNGRFSLILNQAADGDVDVVDLMGRKVWSSKLSADMTTYEINLTSLPKGIYNLSIQTGKAVQSRKIILE